MNLLAYACYTPLCIKTEITLYTQEKIRTVSFRGELEQNEEYNITPNGGNALEEKKGLHGASHGGLHGGLHGGRHGGLHGGRHGGLHGGLHYGLHCGLLHGALLHSGLI